MTRTTARRLLPLLIVGLTALAAACGGSGTGPTTTTGQATTPSTSPATTAAAPPPGDGTARTVTTDTRFATPDGVVTCEITAGSARCDVPVADWPQLPATAASCPSAAFPSLTLTVDGRVEGTCADGALTGAAEDLPSGASISSGGLTCTGGGSSVQCEATTPTGTTGFQVDRDGYRTL